VEDRVTLNWDLITYILGAIIAVASALSAYFAKANNKILNGGSTIKITRQPTTDGKSPTRTVVVDGTIYDERVEL
jgi:hypothetical protein